MHGPHPSAPTNDLTRNTPICTQARRPRCPPKNTGVVEGDDDVRNSRGAARQRSPSRCSPGRLRPTRPTRCRSPTAATPTTGLVDGPSSTSTPTPRSRRPRIFGIEARICKPGADIQNSADFAPTTGGICATTALSAGTQNFSSVGTAPPNLVADLDFKVGVGSVAAGRRRGRPRHADLRPGQPLHHLAQDAGPGGRRLRRVRPTSTSTSASPLRRPFLVPRPASAGTPGNGSANLSWTAPASDGGSAITSYTITPSVGAPIVTGTTATTRVVPASPTAPR